MNVKVRFFCKSRIAGENQKKCIAPFFCMPDGEEYNVWDIPVKQYSKDVENAIKHAFELGYKAAYMSTTGRVIIECGIGSKWLGRYVTAKLKGAEDCRQGWVVELDPFVIKGESGELYTCEGDTVLVSNPPGKEKKP